MSTSGWLVVVTIFNVLVAFYAGRREGARDAEDRVAVMLGVIAEDPRVGLTEQQARILRRCLVPRRRRI